MGPQGIGKGIMEQERSEHVFRGLKEKASREINFKIQRRRGMIPGARQGRTREGRTEC